MEDILSPLQPAHMSTMSCVQEENKTLSLRLALLNASVRVRDNQVGLHTPLASHVCSLRNCHCATLHLLCTYPQRPYTPFALQVERLRVFGTASVAADGPCPEMLYMGAKIRDKHGQGHGRAQEIHHQARGHHSGLAPAQVKECTGSEDLGDAQQGNQGLR